ncbi:MAG TPA: hypothetical protein VG672_25315, partial [Bryobacteraceae bacterium]|nr:hypothetical protein [Bryobacteraceae bacterium]
MPESFSGAAREAAAVRCGAGLADVSWLAKFDLKGLEAAPAPVSGADCWKLGRSHYLVTCDPAGRAAVLEQLQAAPASCTEVTSVYAALLLAGPESRQV